MCRAIQSEPYKKQQLLLHVKVRAFLLQEVRAADFQHYPDLVSENISKPGSQNSPLTI